MFLIFCLTENACPPLAGYLLVNNFSLPNQPDLQIQKPNEAVFVELLVMCIVYIILK